jgi:signal peptidase I
MDHAETFSMKEKILKFIRGWLGSLFVAFLIATSIKSAIADWYLVPTGSMKPTIVEGDRIFTNKLAYDLKLPYTTFHLACWDDPKRGDIVVFNSPTDGKRMVKRVIGIPGDVIAMRDNQLYINGESLEYSPIEQDRFAQDMAGQLAGSKFLSESLPGKNHPVMLMPLRPAMRRSFGKTVVPEGHYFMMGDNRDNSADSRYFGLVERKLILGRANAIVISLDIDNKYRPRWQRFFSKLR